MSANPSRTIELLSRSISPEVQSKAREVLREEGEIYPYRLLNIYMNNPFLRLLEDEVTSIQRIAQPSTLGDLIALRNAAAGSMAPKYAVFCMPKSGSSFIQSALQHSLQLPFVSLTSFATPAGSSSFGMNGREQELDELAIVKAMLQHSAGFVAQHHTRCTPYLGCQLQLYRIRPIVTVRNILDCIVSFDDMMLKWRGNRGDQYWMSDPQFALPMDYERRPPQDRYTILVHAFGTWLINFYVSWRRGVRQGIVDPLIIRFEDDVLESERLVEVLSKTFDLDAAQKARLTAFVASPDKKRARLNVGRKGRGEELLPEHLKAFLADYVAMFSEELGVDEIRYLVR
jgi:hypothetical protein